jgi:hypothetical protein
LGKLIKVALSSAHVCTSSVLVRRAFVRETGSDISTNKSIDSKVFQLCAYCKITCVGELRSFGESFKLDFVLSLA